jgi:hypothetical protein
MIEDVRAFSKNLAKPPAAVFFRMYSIFSLLTPYVDRSL